MARYLAGKTALVTGSAQGIGLGILRALAGAGAGETGEREGGDALSLGGFVLSTNPPLPTSTPTSSPPSPPDVVLHGLADPKALRTLADTVEKEHGVTASVSNADVTDPTAVQAMVAAVRSDHGSLDILCNNAGIQHVSPVVDFPVDKWRSVIDACLNAPFYCTQAAVPGMLESGWGRVINTGSMHALVASPFKSAYNAAKHGVAGFTKTAALELARTPVTVNAVCPGMCESERESGLFVVEK